MLAVRAKRRFDDGDLDDARELVSRAIERVYVEEAIADGRKWLIVGVTATALAAGAAIVIAAIALAS